MMRVAVLAVAAAVPILFAPPLEARAETVAITGATVYPVAGPRIVNGTVVLRDGRTLGVGTHIAIPAGARRIDACGSAARKSAINRSRPTVGRSDVRRSEALGSLILGHAGAGFRYMRTQLVSSRFENRMLLDPTLNKCFGQFAHLDVSLVPHSTSSRPQNRAQPFAV